MKKGTIFFVLILSAIQLSLYSSSVDAVSINETTINGPQWNVPNKIWHTVYDCKFSPSDLPQRRWASVQHDGYYYSGWLNLISKKDGCSVAPGTQGIYSGYLYGGSATTSKIILEINE